MNYFREINIEGPAGNAFNLMATAKRMSKDITSISISKVADFEKMDNI